MVIINSYELLYPPFIEQLREFEASLAKNGLPFHLFHGYRSCGEQNGLYAQGRTKPGKIVTNAKCGQSLHNYGVAGDYVLDGMPTKPGLQWSWQTKADFNKNQKNDWREMGELAKLCGLEWGGNWKKFPDLPHVQNTYGLTLLEMMEIFKAEGLSGVWDAFD